MNYLGGKEYEQQSMPQHDGSAFDTMDRADLLRALEMFAKNWLAHDGSWFLAAEQRFGMETAMDLDAASWKRFAAAEARRIMATFDIAEGGGLEALERALQLRLYAVINPQHTEWLQSIRGCDSSWMFAVYRMRGIERVCRPFPAKP